VLVASGDNHATLKAVAHVEESRVERTRVREFPKNIEAEQVVLGAALLEADAVLPILVDRLVPEYFYEQRHRVIFRAIRELFDQGKPCDVILLANRLEETESMERAGGRLYLNELLDRTTTTASVEYYAEVVRRKATLRALIEAGGRISELGFQESRDTEEVLNQAESMIFDISNRSLGSEYVSLDQFLREHLDALEQLKPMDGHAISGFSTGFTKLDELTAGLQRSDLVIVAGRPGMGKTSFLLTLVRHMAIRESAKIGFFSLEMTKESLLERLLCGEGKVSLHTLRKGKLPREHWRTLLDVAGQFYKTTIMIDDTPSASILEIRARARRMKSKVGLDVVMVDYLQLVEGGIRSDHREQEVAYISRSLKRLARELDVCVIAASQLNRSPEGRTEKRPRLADLRESGAIEQDADVVMFVYREDYHRQQEEGGSEKPRDVVTEAEVNIAKQRNGPTDKVRVMFHGQFASFYPMAL
jgi:replicative DNA helicase